MRKERLQSAFQNELAQLVRTLKDPRFLPVGLVTITEVVLAPDLRTAKVWVSFSEKGDEIEEAAVTALNRAAGKLRGELARRLVLRRAPELQFLRDRGAEMSNRIDELLRGEDV